MRYNANAERRLSWMWDFEAEGGAIGSINMGVTLPKGSLIKFGGMVQTVQFIPAGGAAFMDVGWEGDTQALQGSFNILSAATPASVNLEPYFDFITTEDHPITVTISGAPFTGGQIIFDLKYIQYQL